MQRHPIAPDQLLLRPFHALDRRWMLLTAGSLEQGFNPMTISWGMLGTIWNKPVAMTLVRPTRHTYGFMEQHGDFTLTLFPEALKKQVHGVCGKLSGRDLDKVAAAGLTPAPSSLVGAPGYEEAELVLECRHLYRDDLDPRCFMDPSIHKHYDDDHHRFWIGEVVAISGTDTWSP